jgi:uroporphyrinogen decarboxylase
VPEKLLRKTVRRAQAEGRVPVAPLVGFPGVPLVGSTVKLAQQNSGEHFKVLKAIADTFCPDIVFSLMDLSVEANALGRFTIFPKEDSATVQPEAFATEELRELEDINITLDSRLSGYVETMKLMTVGLPQGVLRGAYVTGPYSLAALLMGAESAAMATVMDPEGLTRACEFATERIQEYVRLLIAAGAQLICILEPTAVMLGPEQFSRFSADYVRHITNSCRYTRVATVYHTCGNAMHLVDGMVASGVDAISLDSAHFGIDLPAAARAIHGEVMVMGNVNPVGALRTGSPEEIVRETTELLESMDCHSNFILSTGCDLPQDTPVSNILAFMHAGRSYHRPPGEP